MDLSPQDILALRQMVYGEGASTDENTMRMMAQSAISRLVSGRGKEFGSTIPEILQKGYYAVKNQNIPYRQALQGVFKDPVSQAKWALTDKVIKDIINSKNYGSHQFYFTPEEEVKLRKKGSKVFNFSAVKPKGKVGIYNTYGY